MEVFFAHPYPSGMKINSFVLGLAAASISASQDAKAQTLMTHVYHEDDFRGYCLDPPYWICRFKGFGGARIEHWLYKNHRRVFIDIRMK
jgi:hypothetical protein